MKPRLLFVVNNPDFFLSHRLPLGLAADAAGYDVHVATPPGPGAAKLEALGFTFHPIVMSRGGRDPRDELRSIAALARLYRRVHPDIVHHVTIKPVLYGGIAARLVGIPAVVSAISGLGYVFLARGARSTATRAAVSALYRVALRHPNLRVIVQNPEDANTLQRLRVLRRRDVVKIPGSGVSLREFVPHEVQGDVPVVVVPSRMLWDKGIGEFVEAAKRLRARGVSARFVLVGGRDPGNPACIEETQLESWVREGHVEWWGFRDDMVAVYRQAHVVCLPSYREGLPRCLQEAAAVGLPVVTTDVPGCRDAVEHGVNGLLVPARDASALADALERLLRDEKERARMGAAGRRRALDEFDVERIASATLQVYADLLAAAASGGTKRGALVPRRASDRASADVPKRGPLHEPAHRGVRSDEPSLPAVTP